MHNVTNSTIKSSTKRYIYVGACYKTHISFSFIQNELEFSTKENNIVIKIVVCVCAKDIFYAVYQNYLPFQNH